MAEKLNASSFTAAQAMPWKILRDQQLMDSLLLQQRVLPRHLQICPSNDCNLSCPWCSCSARDKQQAWTEEMLYGTVSMFQRLGVRGVTVTGGGEPSLWPHFPSLIGELHSHQLEIGLVTNGLMDDQKIPHGRLRWCRVSFSDTRKWEDQRFHRTLLKLEEDILTDMAFSYVVTDRLDERNLLACVDYAEEHQYTHVRVVSDILDYPEASMARARQLVGDRPLVIMQDRQRSTRGASRCLISLLKPVIAADGFIYPCCAAMYQSFSGLDFPERMRMGRWSDLPKIVEEQRYFDGSACDKCYYSGYNQALEGMLSRLDHLAFV